MQIFTNDFSRSLQNWTTSSFDFRSGSTCAPLQSASIPFAISFPCQTSEARGYFNSTCVTRPACRNFQASKKLRPHRCRFSRAQHWVEGMQERGSERIKAVDRSRLRDDQCWAQTRRMCRVAETWSWKLLHGGNASRHFSRFGPLIGLGFAPWFPCGMAFWKADCELR